MEKLGKKRILLDDDQRCRLAIKGKVLGHKAVEKLLEALEDVLVGGL